MKTSPGKLAVRNGLVSQWRSTVHYRWLAIPLKFLVHNLWTREGEYNWHILTRPWPDIRMVKEALLTCSSIAPAIIFYLAMFGHWSLKEYKVLMVHEWCKLYKESSISQHTVLLQETTTPLVGVFYANWRSPVDTAIQRLREERLLAFFVTVIPLGAVCRLLDRIEDEECIFSTTDLSCLICN